VFSLETYPNWFKRLPLYANMLRAEQATNEAARTTLAAERDTIRAAELREQGKRQKTVDAARLQADAAKAKHDDALALYRRAEADAMGPAQNAHHRVSVIERELQRLAHPSIAAALATLLDRFELTRQRSTDHSATLIKLEQIADARKRLEALTITAGVDAAAEVATVMAELDATAIDTPSA